MPERATDSTAAPAPWTPATRLAFRFAFCYLMVYALCCGNATLWEVIPFHIGEHLEEWLAWPFFHAAQWLGQHFFHLTGVGAKLHPTGSGDTILNWIAIAIMLAVAIIATLLWTALDELPPTRRAPAYPKLFFWFRLTLRLTLGVALLDYGLAKFFPLQMPPPSIAVLNEPLGNTSPMTMLWTLIGLNPVYEMICGAAEMLGGVLVLFRRTTLLGSLLAAFLTLNIVLYNFCFDVPVKSYAAHLFFLSLAVLAPDMRGLFNFFILHRPCTPKYGWTKPARRYGLRAETIVTAVVLAFSVATGGYGLAQSYAHQRANQKNPSPLVGQWHVDSATPKPVLTGDGLPMTDLYLEPTGRTMLRASDLALWRAHAHYDAKAHTLLLESNDASVTYALQQPDPTHIVLTPTGDAATSTSTLKLTRIPLPTHYPLLDRGFHFVNEWGLER